MTEEICLKEDGVALEEDSKDGMASFPLPPLMLILLLLLLVLLLIEDELYNATDDTDCCCTEERVELLAMGATEIAEFQLYQ